MKKGEQPEFSAKWWKSSQPKGLKIADRLEVALKVYEGAKKRLESGGDEDNAKAAKDALGMVEAAVGAVVSEASKDRKSPEMALTVEVLKKYDRLYSVEEEWIEDHSEKVDDSEFADPKAYHDYLIGALKRLHGGTMNFGFVLGKKAEDHRLALHRSKGSKALANDLVKQTGLHAMTFGTAMADENRAGVMVLVLEGRQLPGMQKKGERMLKKFKPLPFTKLAVFVDGKEVKDIEDPEDTDVDEPEEVAAEGAPPPSPPPAGPGPQPTASSPPPPSAPGGATTPSGTAAASPPPPPRGGKQAPAEAAALTKELTTLVREMVNFIDRNPAQKVALVRLATEAQISLKQGDLQKVEAGIEALRQALAAAANGAAGQPAPQAAANGSDPAKQATFTKARTAWLATRQKVETDINKLQEQFLSAFKGHAKASDLEKGFRTRVETVLTSMDEELAQALDAARAATDPAQHAKLVQNAKQIIQRYEGYVASDSTIAALDSNPFVPLAIGTTFTATLSVLSRTIV
jgi:hypothetical protein